jgi:hypothetical protein
MISTRAIEIVPLLEDPFDYKEYVAKCRVMDFDILPEGHYAQKLGWLKVGEKKYPNLESKEAYLKFVKDQNKILDSVTISTSKKKGCCGGNKIKGVRIK